VTGVQTCALPIFWDYGWYEILWPDGDLPGASGTFDLFCVDQDLPRKIRLISRNVLPFWALLTDKATRRGGPLLISEDLCALTDLDAFHQGPEIFWRWARGDCALLTDSPSLPKL
jgi:hypothetical protein